MSTRSVPLKRSLIINLAAGVLLLGAVLLAISLLATERTVARLSGALTHRVIATTDADVMGFFEPVQSAIEITAERVAEGEFEDFPLEKLDKYFRPLVERMPQISSIMYAHEDGDEYMLLQTDEHWASRLTRPSAWGGEERWREWQPGDTAPDTERRVENYDARNRPWHSGALERLRQLGADAPLRERIHWTPPYSFFTTGEPGVTASVAQPIDAGRVVVLGFDILLADISRFTSELLIGQRGKVFVLRGAPDDPEGLVVVGLPADERFADNEVLLDFILSSPDDLGGPVASFVSQALELSEAPAGTPVRFVDEGERWWGEIARSRLRTSDDIWVGSVIPERQLLAELPDTRLIVIGATAVVLLLAGLRALRLTRRYSEPLEALTDRGNRMQRLNFEPAEPVESDILEIRHLSATLERMRTALQSFSAEREDLRVARSIRDMTLPQRLPALYALEIATWHEASGEVGGEIFDLFAAGAKAPILHAALFDFPGTGVTAAACGSELRAAFRMAARGRETLEETAASLREFVSRDLPAVGHLRCWLLAVDPSSCVVRWLGYGDPVLFHSRDGTTTQLPGGASLLDEATGLRNASAGELKLAAGDVFAVVSDGVLDALAADRQRYGESCLSSRFGASSGKTPDEIIAGIREDLTGFDTGPRRDRTVIVIRARG